MAVNLRLALVCAATLSCEGLVVGTLPNNVRNVGRRTSSTTMGLSRLRNIFRKEPAAELQPVTAEPVEVEVSEWTVQAMARIEAEKKAKADKIRVPEPTVMPEPKPEPSELPSAAGVSSARIEKV